MSYDNYLDLIMDEYNKICKEHPYMSIHEKGQLHRELSQKYVSPRPESPYLINNKILEYISSLEKEFNVIDEKVILYNLGIIESYPNMSRYQLSLTKKALAECYEKYDFLGSALHFYESGLNDNKNLPVKRKISSLRKLNREQLKWSIDPNTVLESPVDLYVQEDELNRSLCASRITEEYDPAFEEYIEEELNKLGSPYKEEFFRFRELRDFEKDYFLSYPKWVELTLDSFRESKAYQESKEKEST